MNKSYFAIKVLVIMSISAFLIDRISQIEGLWGVIFFIGAVLYIGYVNTSIRALKKRVKALEQDQENERHTDVDDFE